MPLVEPWRKSSLAPVWTNSGWRRKRKMTEARSSVWRERDPRMPSTTAVCRTLPMCTCQCPHQDIATIHQSKYIHTNFYCIKSPQHKQNISYIPWPGNRGRYDWHDAELESEPMWKNEVVVISLRSALQTVVSFVCIT